MKVGIVGSGFVGSTTAYAMMMRGVGREIVLVDLNKERAKAEADDILHAAPFAHAIQIRSGDYADLAGSKVVVITAGVNQRPGETRLQLLSRNSQVFHQIVPQILNFAPQAVLLVATNPVDIMTHLTARFAREFGVPADRVLGSGTTLDTARFRALLGRYLGVDSQHVHAYVLGEHGDSEVLPWSLVTVGGIPLEDFCRMRGLSICSDDQQVIDEQVRRAAYQIIAGKGATYYGVAAAITRIVEVILRDQRSILTVCSPHEDVLGVQDVTLSLPHLVGGEGVVYTLQPTLSEDDTHALRRSATMLREVIDNLEAEQ